MSHQALIDALGTCEGNQSELSRRTGCSQQLISYWLKKEKSVPAEWVIPFEKATGIPKHRYRPDLFQPDDATPQIATA